MSKDYFKTLTPRQQLNDLMHKYAQATGGIYGNSWRELDRRWKARHGDALSWLRWKHNQEKQTALTLPAYIEATGKLEEALAIGHEMAGARPPSPARAREHQIGDPCQLARFGYPHPRARGCTPGASCRLHGVITT